MGKRALWTATVSLGVAAVFMTSFAGPAVLPLLLVAVIVIAGSDRLVAASGLLVGFGATWLVLLGRQTSTGATYDDSVAVVMGIGIFTLASGIVVLIPVVAARLRGHRSSSR